MPTYSIWTVGCQMNKSDSEHLASGLEQLGLSACDNPLEADVVVLNTCVVRQTAEDSATGMLGKLKPLKAQNPDRVVAVMGCMVGPKQNDLKRRFPQVDVWARPQQFDPILHAVGGAVGVDPEGCVSSLVPRTPNIAAFVPIIHGCDKFCSFCIIPYRRGREVSRPVPEVVREVELLQARGVKDVTVLGQNVDSYGHDLTPQADLADLLYAIHEVPGIERIRFLTSHPSDMSRRIIQAVADLPKVCENINLPFQAGDDQVLARMRRGYTRTEYLDKVAEIRDIIPSATLTTDLIVGFSGETESQFQRTVDMLEEVRFDKVHAAAYSVRPGTIAARKQPDTVSREEKKRRLHVIQALQESIQTDLNAQLVGQAFDVLVDGHTRGYPTGRTRTDKLVYVQDSHPGIGETVRVRITESTPWSLRGQVLQAAPVEVEAR